MSIQTLRSLPINIVPESDLWMVCGTFTNETGTGGGVLEWCYDEEDAKSEFERLSKDPRYGSVTFGHY